MKEIVLKVYKFDELSKDSQEEIIERERWNVMEQCMDAYSTDYQESMKAFEDMTDTRVYNWEVGYERYDFSYYGIKNINIGLITKTLYVKSFIIISTKINFIMRMGMCMLNH